VWTEVVLRLEGWVGVFLLIYSLVIITQYLMLSLISFAEARSQLRQQQLVDRLSLFESDLAPPVSILVPAYNEEATIVDSVRSLMKLQYPTFEIIVVNDGSRDGTLQALTRAFGLKRSYRTLRARVPRERVRGVYSSADYPFLIVLDLVNGGKARGLNIALGFSRHPLFCAIDADSVLERDTLMNLALPFHLDQSVLVTGGVVRPANGSVIEGGRVVLTQFPKSHLVRFQTVEYLRGMLAGRLGWNFLDSLFIVSGALGMFSRDAVMAVGGYRTNTIGEDMELVMRLQRWASRKGLKRAVRFVGVAVAWTEVPEELSVLSRQRARWQQGLAESLWLNRGLLFRERFSFAKGAAYLSQLMFELLGPLVELAGYVILALLVVLGRVDVPFAWLYFGIFVLGGTIATMLGVALETIICPRFLRSRDFGGLMLYAFLENVGYRQLTAYWRLQGMWSAIRRKGRWGDMARRGHRSKPDDQGPHAQPAQVAPGERMSPPARAA